MSFTYDIVRSSRRRRLELQVTAEGRVIARAPSWMPDREIAGFVKRKQDWVEDALHKVRQNPPEKRSQPWELTQEEFNALAEQAGEVIPERVAYFAPIVGVTYGRITLRNQKTRWGSCSAKGNLNFNVLLMKQPREALDYVVVHELCHRLEMNHSPRFWAEVERVLPDWKRRKAMLKLQ